MSPRDTDAHDRSPHGENENGTISKAGPRSNDDVTSASVADDLEVASAEITVYENQVPDFIGSELDRLYGTLYSSLCYFQTCGDLTGVSTYVARREGAVTAIFLFRRDDEKIVVVNEGMCLRTEEVAEFVRHVFSAFHPVGRIVFHAVKTDGGNIPFVHHRSFCAEDFIVRLPQTKEAYLARLGPATRKNIKRHKNRLERDFPSFRCRTYPGHEADEHQLRQLIELNRIRMAMKGMASFIDEEEAQRIIRLVRQCGEVLIATIDDRLCGGVIFYRIGKNHISKVIAHDLQYDSYRLGMVCCYLAICDAIARGAKHFHLGHTRYEYKIALLGEFERFDHIVVYRSARELARHGRTALKQVLAGYSLQMNRWLLQKIQHENRFFWRLARRTLNAWRTVKKRRAERQRGAQ
jgi:hypothetical protein